VWEEFTMQRMAGGGGGGGMEKEGTYIVGVASTPLETLLVTVTF